VPIREEKRSSPICLESLRQGGGKCEADANMRGEQQDTLHKLNFKKIGVGEGKNKPLSCGDREEVAVRGDGKERLPYEEAAQGVRKPLF